LSRERGGPPRRRRLRWAVAVGVAGALGANAFAYLHARALTRFTSAGTRTPKPEQLTTWEKVRTLAAGARIPRPVNTRSPADVGLAFATVTVPSADGITLEAWVVRAPGAAGWVLLFHGYSESKQQILPALRRFHDLGFGTVAVDFRASGGSTGGQRTTLGYFEAEDVAATVRWARSNLNAEAPILYGFSMGSAAVLRAVGRLGVAAKAVIVEAPFDRMLSTVENRFRMMHVPAFPMASLLVFWGGAQNGFPGLQHNPGDYARGVTCPALLIHGERDDRVTVPQARAIFDGLAGRKQLQIVPRAGHEASESLSPAEWRKLVESFLATAG
jgi:dipeptidyl aminopeptidase/acylaminoacyl peptidase